jgi:hypothetical protein
LIKFLISAGKEVLVRGDLSSGIEARVFGGFFGGDSAGNWRLGKKIGARRILEKKRKVAGDYKSNKSQKSQQRL